MLVTRTKILNDERNTKRSLLNFYCRTASLPFCFRIGRLLFITEKAGIFGQNSKPVGQCTLAAQPLQTGCSITAKALQRRCKPLCSDSATGVHCFRHRRNVTSTSAPRWCRPSTRSGNPYRPAVPSRLRHRC